MTTSTLFSPLTLASGAVIKNRFLKPAMSEVMGDKAHRPTQQLINLYRRWAEGGTGLLITGNVMIDSNALGEVGNVVIEDESNLGWLRTWAEAGQQNGAQIWVQLNHPGKQSPRNVSQHPVAPSAVPMVGANSFAFNEPRELTVNEIHEIVHKFVRSAEIVKKAGFNGVEIHAAHGYLLNQFLSPHDNRRSDEYGGNLTNRMRILVEIYTGMREAVGDDFSIGVKINSTDFSEDGFSEADSLTVIKKLSELGVDLIEISGGNYENPEMIKTTGGAFFVNYAAKVKAQISTPIAVTGGFKTAAGMNAAVADGATEMVGTARVLALVPDLPRQIRSGQFQSIALDFLSTGIKSLDGKIGSMIGLSYYEMQMARIAAGKPVRRTTNAWIPLSFSLRKQGLSILIPQRN